jgi:hypothetical protein
VAGPMSCIADPRCVAAHRVDANLAAAEEPGVGAELRRLNGLLGPPEPIATIALTQASDAAAAGLVPSHALVDAYRRGRVDADALQHTVHQIRVIEDALQHRAAEAKVAHRQPFWPSRASLASLFVDCDRLGRPTIDQDQMQLRPIAPTVPGDSDSERTRAFWPDEIPAAIAPSGAGRSAVHCRPSSWCGCAGSPIESATRPGS